MKSFNFIKISIYSHIDDIGILYQNGFLLINLRCANDSLLSNKAERESEGERVRDLSYADKVNDEKDVVDDITNFGTLLPNSEEKELRGIASTCNSF